MMAKYRFSFPKSLELGFLRLLAALQNFIGQIVRGLFGNWSHSSPQSQRREKVLADAKASKDLSREGRELLVRQLKMNARAWDVLHKNGVMAGDEFCINFEFAAPNHASNEALKDFISNKTDYQVNVASAVSNGKTWIIQGTTKPLKISEEMVDQWVSDMVRHGMQYKCKFSGWWIWKYYDSGCPDVQPVTKNLGSILECQSGLMRLLNLVKSLKE
jgi:hypothetical protein